MYYENIARILYKHRKIYHRTLITSIPREHKQTSQDITRQHVNIKNIKHYMHTHEHKREIYLCGPQKNASSLYDIFFLNFVLWLSKQIAIPSMAFHPFSALKGVKWRVKRP